MKYNAHNIVQAGHAKMRKEKQTLAQRKLNPSETLKLKRQIKAEIKRLENLLESL
jgi:hypothetical protein